MSSSKKKACNASLGVTAAYFDPADHMDQPKLICVEAQAGDGTWCKAANISSDPITPAALKRAFPRLRLAGVTWDNIIGEIMDKLFRGLDEGTIRAGYVLSNLGMTDLPNGNLIAVRGGEVIGEVGKAHIIKGEAACYRLRGNAAAISMLVPLLMIVQSPVLITLAYTLLASVRSILVEAGISLQAVLLLEGKQGLGKTTIATRVGAVYQNVETKRDAGVIQLGSTFASVRDALLRFKDSVVVIDDLCLSASSEAQRNSLDIAARVMRMATGTIPITKKRGNTTVELYAQAMAIITAEYTFPNLSDMTRCIIAPVKDQMHLPDALTADLCAAAVRHFSKWVIEHRAAFVERMKIAARGDCIAASFDQRIRTNYGILLAVWDEFQISLQPLGVDDKVVQQLHNRFEEALDTALNELAVLIEKVRANEKRGNLAYIILGLLKEGALKPGKKTLTDNDERKERYQKRGCLRLKRRNIGVNPEVLLQLVRAQPGYHDYTRNKMALELKDLGALVLQSNGKHASNMVKLWDGGPWGYRLLLGVLEDEAKEF